MRKEKQVRLRILWDGGGKMQKSDIGLIGLAVMGQNLVLNMASKGYSVSVYNRTYAKTEEFLNDAAAGKSIIGAKSLQELVESLSSPRKVMIMVKAGDPVDWVIEELLPLLAEGDIIIDGGNSFFKDSIRRSQELETKGIHFLGVGVSGGEEGALKGPSIMPGGPKEAWDQVSQLLVDISAKVGDEQVPCCTYLGTDGVGHYVKMIHNGIEYGDMQLICEAYFLMKELLGMSAAEIGRIFARWNETELDSYLIEITADILQRMDAETGQPLVEVILDTAGQKGTGKWTSQDSLDLGVPIPTIAEAVFARFISAMKEERVAASKVLSGPKAEELGIDKEQLIQDIRRALYVSKIGSYAQGFSLMKAAGKEYSWDMDFGEIALIWRGGCIIRAKFLNRIKEAYEENPELENLLLAPYFKEIVDRSQESWRRVVSLAAVHGIPVPGFSSALYYYDSYRRATLPANLLQAQRDYFGAHTYQRIDKDGVFHTQWM